MYHIFLLHENPDSGSRIKDYLQLSGYLVTEGMLEKLEEYEEMLLEVGLILIHCDSPEQCFGSCERIRNITQIPVLVLSQNEDEWVKIKMFQIGVDDYLPETVSQVELIARIRAHITRYRRLSRPFGLIQVRGLEIEATSRRVFVKGKEVSLTQKEFDLLLYMAQRPEQVLSKDEIYQAVWEDSLEEGYYNSVAVHVKRIRQKIEEKPEMPQYIETIWGIGYRFRG